MTFRPPLSLPITLAVVMIVLLIALTVGWVLLAIFGALADRSYAPIYYALLTVGSTFYILLVAGVVMYLVFSIKAVNLTRRQSNFVDAVTHELKSPIASLKLYLQTLHRRQLSAQAQAEFHRLMLEDVERLDRLINQVLETGRLEVDHVRGEFEPVALTPLLAQCAQMVCLRYRVPEDTVRLDAAPCQVLGRSADLDMVFRNLLDNAVKYAAATPQVLVSVRPERDGVVAVQIADNGRGIPLPLRRKIFGRFVRLGSELEREKPGTGLGLYIVRTLVRRLGGSIRVSDREGASGAVFELHLPGAPCAPDGDLPTPDVSPTPPGVDASD
jgi:two-component system, OmpR family, phosphate regulon sensor histidine kinase PhoR